MASCDTWENFSFMKQLYLCHNIAEYWEIDDLLLLVKCDTLGKVVRLRLFIMAVVWWRGR